MMSDQQLAVYRKRIMRACLREAGNDIASGIAAAELLIDGVRAGLVDPSEIADDAAGMEAALSVLDEGLKSMQGVRSAALAVLDEEVKPKTIGAFLYGAGGVSEGVGDAHTEVGRLADRYGESEGHGAITQGALDTAVEPPAGSKSTRTGRRAKGKAGKRRGRSLFKRLRVKKRWKPSVSLVVKERS